MSLEDFSKKIESNKNYKFFIRHKKAINIIQGFFIIGLLIAMNMYVYKDNQIKKEIAENCGYTNSEIQCICNKNYVDNWKDLQNGSLILNITSNDNVELDI